MHLLLGGAAMLCFGIWRGEAETVLNKAIRLVSGVCGNWIRNRPDISQILSRFRGWLQAGAALLANLHLPNFLKGGIYQGKHKGCLRAGTELLFLPCSFRGMSDRSVSVGGRIVKIQLFILYHRLPYSARCAARDGLSADFCALSGGFRNCCTRYRAKKLSARKLKPLTFIKYGVLVIMVILLPALVANDVGMGEPFFCKYLCPQGVLEGALPLAAADEGIRAALGVLFSWKLAVLLSVIVLSVLFYRPFCKWLCPLGAFYALLNKVSLIGMKVDGHKCVSCGKCAKACRMDVDVTKTPDHTECIRCGMCVKACPVEAVSFRCGFAKKTENKKK